MDPADANPGPRILSKLHTDLLTSRASRAHGRRNAAEVSPTSLLAVQDVPRIGRNGGPALSDADLISEVLARGLQSAVATQVSVPIPSYEPSSRSLRPLAVSVKTARELIGVGNTSMWALIKSGQVDVIRPGRRTLVVLASLDAFIASLTASAQQVRQAKFENGSDSCATPTSRRGTAREAAR
jgi:hypothetical protein